ncbi:MAG TPA: phosphatase PAP2 family protein [Candidatus Paceibacterota bacterium]|nr:phosphatase PAP2 family protein [Candidatus Paceibacterota bacterium]
MFLLDEKVFQFLYASGHHNAFWNVLAIFFAQWMPYLLCAAFLLLVYYQKGWRRRVYLFCEGMLAIILARGIVTEVIRYFYHEPRPFSFYGFAPLFNETGWSFPSAHAAWFFALALVVFFANRKWGWWFLGLSILMGLARIYAGVHWPIDIVGGAAVGLACAWFVHWMLKGSRRGLEQA